MDHEYFKDRISGYLDGELRDYEMEAMRRHLEECAECRAIHEDLQKLDLLVKRLSGLDGDEYWEAQAQKIEERLGMGAEPEVTDVSGRSRWGFGWKLAAVAASVGVLTFIGLHQMDIRKQGGSEDRVTRQASSVPDTTAQAVSPGERVSAEAERDAGREKGADQEIARGTVERKADSTAVVDATLKRNSVELNKTIVVTAQDKMKEGSIAPTAAAPKQEALSKSQEADNLYEALADTGRTQAENRAASGIQRAPSRVLPTLNLNLQSGPSTLTQASALTPAARIVTGTLTVPEPTDRLTLADWIERSDSLQTVWNDLNRARKTLTLPSRKDRSSFSDLHMVERQLIEAQFNVGLLAARENPAALEEAARFLRQYVERPDARYRSTARMYLDQLAPSGSGN